MTPQRAQTEDCSIIRDQMSAETIVEIIERSGVWLVM